MLPKQKLPDGLYKSLPAVYFTVGLLAGMLINPSPFLTISQIVLAAAAWVVVLMRA